MTELAVQRTAIHGASAREREAALLAYIANAYQSALLFRGAAERYDVVRDVDALKAMAKAYCLSATAARKLGETAILCLRLFGLALRESHPGESNDNNRLRSQITGASPGLCQHASVIASYSEKAVIAAFEKARKYGQPAAFKYVYAWLRSSNPRVQQLREERGADSPELTAQRQMEKALQVCLALAFRIMEAKEYTLQDAKREYGISQRTFERHIARLRTAGMLLDRSGDGYVRFVAIDTTLSGARVA